MPNKDKPDNLSQNIVIDEEFITATIRNIIANELMSQISDAIVVGANVDQTTLKNIVDTIEIMTIRLDNIESRIRAIWGDINE